jgi:hypothetical protein
MIIEDDEEYKDIPIEPSDNKINTLQNLDNPDIPKGEEIITDVLKPQINFQGVVIQTAKVEVSKSY